MSEELKDRALALYAPPFRYEHGYVWDSRSEMVADDKGEDGKSAVALRVRGWGRIGYMENTPALQDEVGRQIAQALTEYWEVQAEMKEQDSDEELQASVQSALHDSLHRPADPVKEAMAEALAKVANSGMAMREEDEGNVSPVLVQVRTALAAYEEEKGS